MTEPSEQPAPGQQAVPAGPDAPAAAAPAKKAAPAARTAAKKTTTKKVAAPRKTAAKKPAAKKVAAPRKTATARKTAVGETTVVETTAVETPSQPAPPPPAEVAEVAEESGPAPAVPSHSVVAVLASAPPPAAESPEPEAEPEPEPEPQRVPEPEAGDEPAAGPAPEPAPVPEHPAEQDPVAPAEPDPVVPAQVPSWTVPGRRRVLVAAGAAAVLAAVGVTGWVVSRPDGSSSTAISGGTTGSTPVASQGTGAGGAPTAPPAQPPTGKVDGTGTWTIRTAGGGRQAVRVLAVSSYQKPSGSGGKPPQLGRFVTIRVLVRSIGSGPVTLDPKGFRAITAQGKTVAPFELSAATETGSTPLKAGTLAPKKQLVGTLTFDVPTGPVTIVYSVRGSQVAASWTIT